METGDGGQDWQSKLHIPKAMGEKFVNAQEYKFKEHGNISGQMSQLNGQTGTTGVATLVCTQNSQGGTPRRDLSIEEIWHCGQPSR
eukprot:12163419-Prorocentrum_lima.AAC.1